MVQDKLRPILQINVMLIIISIAALTGWACGCGSGSDYPGYPQIAITSRDAAQAGDEGIVTRWHDFFSGGASMNDKDAAYLQDWLQTGDVMMGLLVPQAPGAVEPGSVTTRTNTIGMSYQIVGERYPRYFDIPLQPDPEAAKQLNDLFPAPSGKQWQALKPANLDWLSQVPTQTIEIQNISGWINYQLDFHGGDECNHCEVQLTGCTTRQFSFGEQVLMKGMGLSQVTSNGELTCAEPIPTTILLHDDQGAPLPGNVVLSFGFWGGPAHVSTITDTVSLTYHLAHTDSVTRTVKLGTIQSAEGWSYHWENMTGQTITQLEVGPLPTPHWEHMNFRNIRLVAENLPTCASTIDTVNLSASLALTPTITAEHQLAVQLLPNEATCPIKDVGVQQLASSEVISAGQSITFTWTITNYESSAASVTLTGTFSPAAALADATLPGGCTRNGGVLTCQVNDIPAQGSAQVQVTIETAAAYSGPMSSIVEVQPVGATDSRIYDNRAGPWQVTIKAGGGPAMQFIYLPLVIR
jgi:hypothetical protein